MFAGIKMFRARLRLILAKMSLRRVQNVFMPKNINSITINITLEGIEERKTEKNDMKTLRRKFFSPALWENVNKLWNGFSILIGCLDRTIIWFSFFIGFFQRAKIHYSPPNSPFWPAKCATMPDKVIIILHKQLLSKLPQRHAYGCNHWLFQWLFSCQRFSHMKF